jgi:hypothetical protein
MRICNREELKGVIGHELSHVINRDILTSSIAATLAGAIMMIGSMIRWGAIFGMGHRDDEEGGIPGLLIAGILAPIAATLIQLAISRTREYQADANGAKLAHNPLYLASALRKLEAANERLPMDAPFHRQSSQRGWHRAPLLHSSADRRSHPETGADGGADTCVKVEIMEEAEEKGRGFKVQDRRRFSAEGDAKAESEESSPAPEPSRESTAEQPKPRAEAPATGAGTSRPHPATDPGAFGAEPEINFATFLVGLSSEALGALGEIPDPATGEHRRDLRAAQQLIDIIAVLRDKTRGNLDQNEQSLIEAILFDLRMKYVELARQPAR